MLKTQGGGQGLSTNAKVSGFKNVCAAVPMDIYLQLLRLKAETGKSLYEIVREAIEDYIEANRIKLSGTQINDGTGGTP